MAVLKQRRESEWARAQDSLGELTTIEVTR